MSEFQFPNAAAMIQNVLFCLVAGVVVCNVVRVLSRKFLS